MSHRCLCNDLIIITDNINAIQLQIHKLWKFVEWSHVDLNLSKRAKTWCSIKSKLKPNTLKVYIQAQLITYKNNNFPSLTQNERYPYLGIHFVPSLKWKIQKEVTTNKAKKKWSNVLSTSLVNLKQNTKILNMVIKASIVYAFYAGPLSKLDINKLDKILIKNYKWIWVYPKAPRISSITSP